MREEATGQPCRRRPNQTGREAADYFINSHRDPSVPDLPSVNDNRKLLRCADGDGIIITFLDSIIESLGAQITTSVDCLAQWRSSGFVHSI